VSAVVWPLLAGERAHYELLAGRKLKPPACWRSWKAGAAGQAVAGAGVGRPADSGAGTGSRRPERLGDAAGLGACEHIKLLRSLTDGAVLDLPPQPGGATSATAAAAGDVVAARMARDPDRAGPGPAHRIARCIGGAVSLDDGPRTQKPRPGIPASAYTSPNCPCPSIRPHRLHLPGAANGDHLLSQ